jgi:hypothetical protein
LLLFELFCSSLLSFFMLPTLPIYLYAWEFFLGYFGKICHSSPNLILKFLIRYSLDLWYHCWYVTFLLFNLFIFILVLEGVFIWRWFFPEAFHPKLEFKIGLLLLFGDFCHEFLLSLF